MLLSITTINSCSTNLECDTLCCHNDVCEDSKECKKENTKIYVAISVVAFVFLLAAFIYLFYNSSEIRASVIKMQKEMAEKEEGSKNIMKEDSLKQE